MARQRGGGRNSPWQRGIRSQVWELGAIFATRIVCVSIDFHSGELATARGQESVPLAEGPRSDMPKMQVNCRVEKAEEDAQRYLGLTREPSWVHDGRHVVLNEATRVL